MRKRAIVAIVGRPNIGKSTLFNRMLRRRQAVVHDTSGVTRDRSYGTVQWNERAFDVVDTGGLLPRAREGMDALVRESALAAIEEADLLLVLVDVNTGITDLDQELARLILRSGRPTILVANKADDEQRAVLSYEFTALGLGTPQAVSALHGTGVGDLLDRVVQLLPKTGGALAPDDAELHIAIIGKPNVGKSSLLNALLREERVLVSEEPGTTRDAIDSRLKWHGHAIDLIDTAGIRKRSRLSTAVDVFATMRSERSIERSDVCLLLFDASQPISQQDVRIAGVAHKAGKGIVACFNKWDLVEKDSHTAKRFEQDFQDECAFMRYAPVLFISAKEKTRIHKVLETAWMVGEVRAREIATVQINRVLEAATQRNPPHHHGGGNGQVKYGLQVDVKPPRFAVYVNNPAFFDRAYIRYLNNSLRSAFEFPGTALRIELRPSPGRRLLAGEGR